GQPPDAERDRGRRCAGALTRRRRRGADRLRPRDGAGGRRTPGERLSEEVLRLVPRPGAVSEAVQARARAARVDRGGRHAPARGVTRCGGARGAARGRATGPCRRDPARLDADLDLRRRLTHSSLALVLAFSLVAVVAARTRVVVVVVALPPARP